MKNPFIKAQEKFPRHLRKSISKDQFVIELRIFTTSHENITRYYIGLLAQAGTGFLKHFFALRELNKGRTNVLDTCYAQKFMEFYEA